MSKNKRSHHASNVNVTTYSGFSKLRFWSKILSILFLPNFFITGIIWSTVPVGEFSLLAFTAAFLILAHVLAMIVLAVMRNAYRV
jgi:cytochrome b subunit of formate dehydrogenase